MDEQLNNGENGLETINPAPTDTEAPTEGTTNEIDYAERLDSFKNKFANKKFATANATKTYFTKNLEDKSELEFLYRHFFNKEFSNCSDCLVEAYLQVLNYKVDQEKEACQFLLFAGALLEDNVNFDASLAMSNFNITQEKCLFFLAQNPLFIDRFQKKPDNWKELVEEYKSRNK